MGTIFVIFLLLVLCGFVAYIGDLLGRRFGKKRLTVFGLRPKHTAILLTVATGVLIAALTFSVALVSVPGFLRVVTQGEKLVGQNRRLARNNRALAKENDQRKQDNARLEQHNTELQQTTTTLQQAKEQLTTSNAKLEAQNHTLTAQNQTLGSQNKKLDGENKSLQGANKELASTNKSLQGRNDQLAKSNHDLVAAKAGLAKSVAELSAQARDYRHVVRDYKEAAYVFRRDDEIARQVVPANPPASVVRETVNTVIFRAETEAAKRNALEKGAHKKLIELVRHAQLPPAVGTDPTALKDWVVGQASRVQNTPIVVRIVADENCVRGRAVPVRLEWYPNDRVLRKDQSIAEVEVTVLPTTVSRPRMQVMGFILHDVIAFLRDDVGPSATSKHNMIPNPEGLGSLNYDELLPVCDRIYELGHDGGRVKVLARARQDTLRAGPLNVYLDVDENRQARGGG